MALRFSYCPYRLLFKRPFGTAHGSRDGTDSLFIRAEEDGFDGYGEVTLPPYVKETIPEVIERLRSVAARQSDHAGRLLTTVDQLDELKGRASGFRAGLTMALIDLISKHRQWSVRKLLELDGAEEPVALATIGICPTDEVEARMSELPPCGAWKVKVGDANSTERIKAIMTVDTKLLFLDGNAGLRTVNEAGILAQLVGRDRLLGVEQPFQPGLDDFSRELADHHGITVFADESVQDEADLALNYANYDGLNVKLMKCGGLDRAKTMAAKARRLGMKVMLGSMSESSLGCSAMAQLSGEADIVDLDGPWLIKNDPFEGITMLNGSVRLPDCLGVGAVLKEDLEFNPISP